MAEFETTKICPQCGEIFEKTPNISWFTWETQRKFCSRTCKSNAQKGKPSGKAGWKKPEELKSKNFIPCRICGEPTRYHGDVNSKLYGKVHCGRRSCKTKAREITNERIRQRHISDYASGKRKKLHDGWNNIQRISPEEQMITQQLKDLGWQPQYKFITGLKGKTDPKVYWLDFAKPENKLYVEIDGSSHRLHNKRDVRRDTIISQLGWEGRRIPSESVREDPDKIIKEISLWTRLLIFSAI